MGKILNTSSLSAKYILPDMSERQINIESNTTSTENMTTSFEKKRSSAQNFGVPGESITQTITLTNNSEYELTNVSIKDDIGQGATFKSGSVRIGGTDYAQFDPVQGFTLQSPISANGNVIVTYDIVVDEMPTTDQINLVSNITYTVDGKETFTEKTNVVEIQIEEAKVEIQKSVNKTIAISGDTLSFVNVITNSGNVKVENVVFTDILPEGTTFVTGSVTIDSTTQPDADPTKEITLNDLEVNDEITLSFDVKVS